jgi:hypothetical protein
MLFISGGGHGILEPEKAGSRGSDETPKDWEGDDREC